MKIRIQGNSLRLRLMQQEVLQFSTTGLVEENIQFGQLPSDKLTYRLIKSADRKTISADFEQQCISVYVPAQMGEHWSDTDQISMETHNPLDANQSLRILIEKDFKCLTERSDEDESDAFPNPNLNC